MNKTFQKIDLRDFKLTDESLVAIASGLQGKDYIKFKGEAIEEE